MPYKRRPDDPQQHLVYEWEDGFRDFQLNTLTLAECRVAIRTACRRYGVKPPRVIQHNKRSYSWSDGKRISLQAKGFRKRGGKNLATCLHEAAHHIVTDGWGTRHHHAHGPTFMGVYLWLLAESKVAPDTALAASARAAGLHWRWLPPVVFRTRAPTRKSS